MTTKKAILLVGVSLIALPAMAGTILFDFDGGPAGASFPLDQSAGGITAHLSGAYFIEDSGSFPGATPTGFSGLSVIPTGTSLSDLLVGFSGPLTEFSIMFAPNDNAADGVTTVEVDAFMGGSMVGSSTAQGTDKTGAPTWPSGTLSFSLPSGFDSVKVFWQSTTIAGGEGFNPIFMADNMSVTPKEVTTPSVPETLSTGLALLVLALGAGVRHALRKA